MIRTSSWFHKLPDGHTKIGVSRGVPRQTPAGYRMFRKLAPGSWFNSVSAEEYCARYHAESLRPLDPRTVATELLDLAGGGVAVLVCFERAGGRGWCHRSLAAGWLADELGWTVPELGYECLDQHEHPLLPPHLLRRDG